MTRTKYFLPLICAGAFLLGVAASSSAQLIKANPNPVVVPPGQTSGTTTLTWDGGKDHPYAEVWVRVDENDETFIVEQGTGTRQVTVELGKSYVFKLSDANVLLASVTVTAQPQAGGAGGAGNAGPGAEPFTGTWNTIAGGTHFYTVTLKQIGNTVTGSYSPGNGKIFDGVVTGNKLTFKWSQDGGYEGTGEFTLDENRKGFQGSATALKPHQFTNTWNSFVLSVAGVWNAESMNAYMAKQLEGGGAVAGVLLAAFPPGKVTLTLQQEGDKVTGTYTRVPGDNGLNFGGKVTVPRDPNAAAPQQEGDKATGANTTGNGKLEGTITGNILLFKWTSDGGSGRGRLVFDKSEMAFSGTYRYCDDLEKDDEAWKGTRKKP